MCCSSFKIWVQRLGLMPVAAWTYELYRLVRRPDAHGALVAIWWREQLQQTHSKHHKDMSARLTTHSGAAIASLFRSEI